MTPGNIVIGVVTTVQPRRRHVQGSEGRVRPSLYFCRMAQHAHNLGASLVMFGSNDVDWSHNSVRGWVPEDVRSPYGLWVRKTTKLPSAIYENVFVHLAVAGYSRSLRDHARRRGIPLFNPPLPDKWNMSHWMSRNTLDKYLPPTVRLNVNDVPLAVRRINEWGTAYVKPIGGYGGVGVMRVEKWERDRYRIGIDRQKDGGGKLRITVRTEDLVPLLRRRGRTPHIVQRGIRLLAIDGRKVDFRVVVQRGADGGWHLIGIVPKVAAADGVVTNLVAGGERMSLQQLEALAARDGVKVPVADLTACALDVAAKLTRYAPKVGLLGFDLGVDDTGRTWVIEMNPKPARSLLTDDMQHVMAKHAAGFAVYLARHRPSAAL